MLYAALETSTEWCSVALWRDGEGAGVERRAGNRHSEIVLPILEGLLRQEGKTLQDLEGVAFGAGPGSFTGLRIACGVAQGLAFARNLPVIGISTLEALAEECGAPRVLACLDARMREVYYSAYERDGERWREVLAAQCVPPAALRVPPGKGWVGCGNGFAAYPDMKNSELSAVMPEIHPSALAVARLAAPRLASGEGVDAALAAPLYVRDKVAWTTEELKTR